LLDALERACARLGNVTLIDQGVKQIEHAGGRIAATLLADGRRVVGDQYVLATGATVSDLLRASGIDLAMPRVFYGVGVSVEFKSPEFPHSACVRTPNRGLACGLYSAPYQPKDDSPTDHIIVGASNFISTEPHSQGRIGSIEALLQGAIQQLNTNFYKAEFIGVNVGWRPISQDTYPLMGRTSIDNLTIVSGTRREGIHLAPVISSKVATLVKGGTVDAEFDCFKPERSIIKALSREQAIEKGVRHQISAAYQHGFAPPKSRLLEQLRAQMRGELERLHDQVGAIDWGIPPEMHDMYRYGHAVA
jgi:glycine/D-amino acid oxidase-like deaminating enzyme